jgi:hypothetical protein
LSGVSRSVRAVVTGLAVATLAVGVTMFAGNRPEVDPAPAVVAARPIPAPGEQSVTALALSVATPPRMLVGSDGRNHIAYDLLSTNATPVTITLTGVEVTTLDGRPLAR